MFYIFPTHKWKCTEALQQDLERNVQRKLLWQEHGAQTLESALSPAHTGDFCASPFVPRFPLACLLEPPRSQAPFLLSGRSVSPFLQVFSTRKREGRRGSERDCPKMCLSKEAMLAGGVGVSVLADLRLSQGSLITNLENKLTAPTRLLSESPRKFRPPHPPVRTPIRHFHILNCKNFRICSCGLGALKSRSVEPKWDLRLAPLTVTHGGDCGESSFGQREETSFQGGAEETEVPRVLKRMTKNDSSFWAASRSRSSSLVVPLLLMHSHLTKSQSLFKESIRSPQSHGSTRMERNSDARLALI